MLGLLLTPAWLTPPWFSTPWLVGVLALAGPGLWWSWRHAPWVPTPADDVDIILRLLALGPGDRFCDLGAGDGRMVQRVHHATGADCTGIEGVPLLYAIGWLRALPDAGCHMQLGDLTRVPLETYDALYIWGTAYGSGTAEFVQHLRARVRPGTRVVCYHTPLADLPPAEVDATGQRPVYAYEL